MANTGLLILPYELIQQGATYDFRINVLNTADLISIFDISSTTKKFIKVIQTGNNAVKTQTIISMNDASLQTPLQTFRFKRNSVTLGIEGYSTSIIVLFNELISGFLVYLENGKFVFDFQTFVYRDDLFPP